MRYLPLAIILFLVFLTTLLFMYFRSIRKYGKMPTSQKIFGIRMIVGVSLLLAGILASIFSK
jgi:hypothetical protein